MTRVRIGGEVLMAKRMTLMLVIATVVVAGLGFVKFRQVKAAMAVYAAYQPPPEAVDDREGAAGTVARDARRDRHCRRRPRRDHAPDLPGIVERIAFDSGQTVKEGDVLVQLDTRQEQAQLTAAEAQRELRASQSRADAQPDRNERIVSQAEYDQADAPRTSSAEATRGEIRATIGRKTIRAPFSGVLGLRQVNLGQYLAGGAPIVSLQSLNPIYVNFAVPQQQVATLKVGTAVRVTIDDTQLRIVGRVTALDSVVDPATRNVQVQATFPNADGRLRPGMFVQADRWRSAPAIRWSRCRRRRSATRRTAIPCSSSTT